MKKAKRSYEENMKLLKSKGKKYEGEKKEIKVKGGHLLYLKHSKHFIDFLNK